MTNCRIKLQISDKGLHDAKGIQWSGKIKGASTEL